MSRGQSMIVKSDRIVLKDLTHCTNYSITIAGWNDLTTVTNKPMYIKTLPKGSYTINHMVVMHPIIILIYHCKLRLADYLLSG